MQQPPAPRLSVIVPVGPGERAWRALLPQLAPLAPFAEVLLVAAEAEDGDTVASTTLPVKRLLARQGRASQQNAGARAAAGRWLWFLHADSRLGADAPAALLRALEGRRAEALYYFDLRFLPDGPRWTGLNAFGTWLRSRLFRLPFGDQGLLLSAEAFARLGGFDETVALGEDLSLVLTAQQSDLPIRPIGAVLRTSARRYAERGWARNTWRNLRLTWQLSRAHARRQSGAVA
jgi:rSAM/selenodomain-associated transferase 2